jgi:hypothetical protein
VYTIFDRIASGRRALATSAIASVAVVDLAMAAALALLGAVARLSAQDGIPLNPDSYQFLLVIKGLSHGLPLDASLGVGGDAWSIPFYRIGYPFLAFPIYLLTRDPEAAAKALSFAAGTATVPAVYFLALLALRSRAAAIGAGLTLALSFSAAAWSNFVMPEATAAFVLTLAMLLAYLAGCNRSRAVVVVAALSAAILVLVRFDLILTIPSLVAFMALGARSRQSSPGPIIKTYLVSMAGLLAVFGLTLCWAAGNVMSGFSFNPAQFLSDHFVDPTAAAHEGALVFAGLHDFLNREPLLVVGGGAGLLLATRWRPEYRWALWLQVAPLLVVYLPRNDMRYFALLVPALAFGTGLLSREAWEFLSRFVARQRALPALLLATASSVALLGLVLWQVDLTNDTWHASRSYEYTAATMVEQRLADSNLSGQTTLCAHYAEAYYYVTELPTRRADIDALAACLDTDGHSGPVLLIVDAPLRMSARDGIDGLEEAAGPVVLEVSPSAPFLHGHRSYLDTELIRGYLLR